MPRSYCDSPKTLPLLEILEFISISSLTLLNKVKTVSCSIYSDLFFFSSQQGNKKAICSRSERLNGYRFRIITFTESFNPLEGIRYFPIRCFFEDSIHNFVVFSIMRTTGAVRYFLCVWECRR